MKTIQLSELGEAHRKAVAEETRQHAAQTENSKRERADLHREAVAREHAARSAKREAMKNRNTLTATARKDATCV